MCSALCAKLTDFEKNGHEYTIERGRKPNIFKFVVDNKDLHDDETDEMQGEGRLSQQQIENVLGMNLGMFKQIIQNPSYFLFTLMFF